MKAGVAREAGLPASLAKTALKMLQDAGIIRHEIRDSTIGEIVEVELVLDKEELVRWTRIDY